MAGNFTLVYLVRNTITNLTTQDEQVECFRNAAAHLVPGGCFVIENYIPQLRRLPPGQTVVPFAVTPEHLHPAPLPVAARTGPNGADRRDEPALALRGLEPLALYQRQFEPHLGLAEVGSAVWTVCVAASPW